MHVSAIAETFYGCKWRADRLTLGSIATTLAQVADGLLLMPTLFSLHEQQCASLPACLVKVASNVEKGVPSQTSMRVRAGPVGDWKGTAYAIILCIFNVKNVSALRQGYFLWY